MFSAEVIQIVIQGGAVGLLLAFGYLGYRLANRVITVGMEIITNHMSHVEAALLSMERSMTRFDAAVERYFERERLDRDE